MATRTTTQFFVPPSAFASTPHPVTAHGTRIRYADGHECLDGVSGLWNVPLGYGHRGVADAVHHALIDASYLTHFRAGHAWADRASSALLGLTRPGEFTRVLHVTSGSAAVDAVIKLARQFQLLRGEPRRRVIGSSPWQWCSGPSVWLGAQVLSAGRACGVTSLSGAQRGGERPGTWRPYGGG